MSETATSSAPALPPRGRFQYGLGTLFLVTTLVSVGLALWNTFFRPFWSQRSVVEKFKPLQSKIVVEPAAPAWLRWIPGADRLVRVKSLDLEHCTIKDADLDRLPELIHLEKLYLARTGVTDKAMLKVAELRNLQRLSLWGTAVTDAGIQSLGKLASLRRLDIQETPVTAASLATLKALPNLSVLRHSLKMGDAELETLGEFPKLRQGCAEHLRLEKVTERGMRFFGRMQGVVWLEVSDAQIEPDWKPFARLSTLKSLALAKVDVGSDGLRTITELPQLEFLVLSTARIGDGRGGGSGGDQTALGNRSKLKTVSLENVDLCSDGLQAIAELPRLESLSVRNSRIAGGWQHVEKMRSLRQLTIERTNWSREGAEAVAGLPNAMHVRLTLSGLTVEDVARAWGGRLTGLWVDKPALVGRQGGQTVEFWPGYRMTEDDLRGLEDFSAATSVVFGRGIDPDSLARVAAMPAVNRMEVLLPLSDQILSKASQNHGLRTLVFRHTEGCEKCSPEAFRLLAAMTDLEGLEFEGHKPTSEQLAVLKDLPQLRQLKIRSGSNFTDAGMSYLKDLTRLESLEIGAASQITDAGMAHLSRLTALRRVSLHNANVTDAGLKCLEQLPALESVELGERAKISRLAAALFKQAHPKCRLSVAQFVH